MGCWVTFVVIVIGIFILGFLTGEVRTIIGIILLGGIGLVMLCNFFIWLFSFSPPAVRFEKWRWQRKETLTARIKAAGVAAMGVVISLKCHEHGPEVDYRIKFRYYVGSETYRKTVKFCMDWVHVGLAHRDGHIHGELSEEGLKAALQPGTAIMVCHLPGKPRACLIRLPEYLARVWKYEYFN